MSSVGRKKAGSATKPKQAITLRLAPEVFRVLERFAAAENRTPTNYVETTVLRDLSQKDEAARIVTMLVTPEVAALPPGPLLRTEGESDERYAQRTGVMDYLFALPDSA